MIDNLRRGRDVRLLARLGEISRSLDSLRAQLERATSDVQALVADLRPDRRREAGIPLREDRRHAQGDRRSGDERRRARPEGVVARVLVAAERRGPTDRRSGDGRRRDDVR
jgi:hypothetical protein